MTLISWLVVLACCVSESSLSVAGDDPVAAPELALFADVPAVAAASGYEQSTSESPASVTVISAEEIERFGYRTIADVLRAAAGMFTTSDHNYTYAAVRGFGLPGDYNTRILLLLDGLRVNDEVFETAYLGTELGVPLEMVERIEIVRGASSALYGANAMLAVINVITRDPAASPADHVTLEAGDRGRRRAGATWSFHGKGQTSAYVHLTAGREAGGELTFPEFDGSRHGPTVDRLDGDDVQALLARIRHGGWTFSLTHIARSKEVPTASFETVWADTRERTIDRTLLGALRYERMLSTGAVVSGALSYNRLDYRGWYPYDDGLLTDGSRAVHWGVGLRYLDPPERTHRLLVGLEYRAIPTQLQFSYFDDPGQDALRIDHRSSVLAGFVQDQWRLAPRFTLNLGVRHDTSDEFDSATSPRVALIYSANAASTWKLLAGRSFRQANDFEARYGDGVTQRPNTSLSAERLDVLEMIYGRTLGARGRIELTGYAYRLDDQIAATIDPDDGLIVYDNLGGIDAHGIEIEAEGELVRGISGRASIAWQRPRDAITHDHPSNAPRQLVKAAVWVPLTARARGLGLGLSLQHVSSRRTIEGGRIDPYTRIDGALHWAPQGTPYRLGLLVDNLLDTDYADPGGAEHRQAEIPQLGRTFRLQLGVEF